MLEIKFNDKKIPTPVEWNENYEVIENINTTEAGTDQIIITRNNKLTVKCGFNCTHIWAKNFLEYSKADKINVSFYDLLLGESKIREMRIRDFTAFLIPNAWKINNGLWEVSFSLIEF